MNFCRSWQAALFTASLLSAPLLGGVEAPAPVTQPAPAAVSDTPRPEGVVVVANSRDPESVQVARYYMQKRKIPDKNLILIDTKLKPEISWTDFIETIFNPLRYRLTKEGWLEAYTTELHDREGRWRYVFYGNKIDFLVLCYGIPIKIEDDAARLAASSQINAPDQFKTNHGSVDGELALLAAQDTPLTGLVPNPLYRRLGAPHALVVRVARLDGPSPAAVRGLVDSALAGEAEGLQGRAYIDLGGPHPQGEGWLKEASGTLRKLGYDISEDHEKGLFGWKQRFDAPALYFGWYAYDIAGPMADAQFRFPPGAVAIHIHSYSGAMLRDGGHRWVGPFVARGVAATVGNVYEPYLEFTHHVDMFAAALAANRTTGEAAYYSLPALSWQAVFVGDPLYRPFAFSLAQQLEAAEKKSTPWSAYAVIRQMNLLREQGRDAEARDFGRQYLAAHPGLALAFALAQTDAALGNKDGALKSLAAAVPPSASASRDDLGLLGEVAQWAAENGGAKIALGYYAAALAAPSVVPDFIKAVAPEAIELARKSGDEALAQRWQTQLDAHKPPPTPAAAPGKP